MPTVCVCGCGFTVQDGALCLDWQVVGMHHQCSTAPPYSFSLAGSSSSLEWFHLRNALVVWTNQTCRTHRVIVRAQLPYVLMKLGENNAWQVRVILGGAVDASVPYDDDDDPALFWSSVWSGGLPVGTDGEQQTPGAAKREYIVPPGSTLTADARVQARTPVYTARPANLLAFGELRVSLAAWPAKTDSGSGQTCGT